MGRTAAQYVRGSRAGQIVVINRTLAHAEALAAQVGGTAQPFEELHRMASRADLVICTTASPTPLFGAEDTAVILQARRERPLLMVDLAVPRDIAPEVRGLDGVRVYDVDDLQRYVAENVANRGLAAKEAEALVVEEVARFARDRSVREGVPVLASLRRWGEETARAEVERTLSAIGKGLTQAQRNCVEAMARAIVNKLLHGPTSRLREPGAHGVALPLNLAAAELFGLTEVS
jgi:glutamyl-tRNA reductase